MKHLIFVLVFSPVLTFANTYTTNFPLTENPISENSNWINGAAIGLDWNNVQTNVGFAFGSQLGTDGGNAEYDDSTAVLTGSWGPDQTAQATVAVRNASGASGVFQEVELRLRTTVTGHSIAGYEINCSVSTNYSYLQIVRWNGTLGNWTLLDAREVHAVNGDVLQATISGSTITAYLNGAQIVQVTDSTYTSGSPGIGFFLQGASSLNANYGFSSFSATDGANSDPTPSPTPSPSPSPPSPKPNPNPEPDCNPDSDPKSESNS